MTAGQFAAALFFGLLSVLLPLVIFMSIVAACVYVARWWMGSKNSRQSRQ